MATEQSAKRENANQANKAIHYLTKLLVRKLELNLDTTT